LIDASLIFKKSHNDLESADDVGTTIITLDLRIQCYTYNRTNTQQSGLTLKSWLVI